MTEHSGVAHQLHALRPPVEDYLETMLSSSAGGTPGGNEEVAVEGGGGADRLTRHLSHRLYVGAP
jgi:hypothetical protein